MEHSTTFKDFMKSISIILLILLFAIFTLDCCNNKKLKQEKYAISDDDLRPYFELENVKKGVFGLAQRLYGITFKENKNIQVYHPEVTAYEVFDEKGKFLAVYYADFHPRDGKRGGAWMNDFQPQYMKGKKDHRPHIVNVMNFTRPTADKPALFTYD